MNEAKHIHDPHGGPIAGHVQQHHRPYWTRVHRDRRVWVGVVLMLVAMMIYVMTGDLAWRPRNHSQQPLSGAAGK